MRYKRFLVIGGSKGIGKAIVDHFEGDSVSRTNGYDIRRSESRQEIAQKSLDYDVVVNHAYCGDFSQILMLKDLYQAWCDNRKEGGYLLNTGTIATYRFDHKKKDDWWFYVSTKAGLDIFSNYMNHGCSWNSDLRFRMTNIRPGMLDTEKSRQKPHFKNGIRGEDYCRLIEYLLSTPEDLMISEITMDARGF